MPSDYALFDLSGDEISESLVTATVFYGDDPWGVTYTYVFSYNGSSVYSTGALDTFGYPQKSEATGSLVTTDFARMTGDQYCYAYRVEDGTLTMTTVAEAVPFDVDLKNVAGAYSDYTEWDWFEIDNLSGLTL